MSFWGELKRRNVYKVGVAYAIVAWLIVQAAAIVFPHLDFPEWTVPFVIVLLIIGFPLILLFAWAFEITPEGIKRTKQVPLSESITHLTGQKLNYIVMGLLVLAVAYLLFDKFYFERRATKPEMVSTETEQAPAVNEAATTKKTIAVLPFENLSSDPEQGYFVDGLSEEILNSLAQIPDLLVTGRTSSFTFKGSNKKTPEIANELGVENILEGSVRKAGNILRITAQLLRAKDGFHLWSKSYDRELKDVADILSIQEDIATAVANELKLTLGIGESLKQLGGTDNVEAYELYLVAQGLSLGGTVSAYNRALESFDAAIALDPEFAIAWAAKANNQFLISLLFDSANRANVELDKALRAAQKAIEIEPNLADGYFALGTLKGSKGEWIEAESAFRKALELQTEPLSASEGLIAVHYNSVGYFKRAYEILTEMRLNDPLNQGARAQYVLCFGLLGDTQRAEVEYQLGRALFGDQWSFGDSFITYIRLGSKEDMSRDKIVYSDPINDVAKEYLESPKEGLLELHRLYSNNDITFWEILTISMWAAYFGDPEFAIDAMDKAVNVSASGVYCLWSPVFQEVRQLPRFKEFVREIGLVDYWNKFGWPDICRPLDNGDFECD